MPQRAFKIEILVENDCETLAEGLQNAKKTIESLGLKIEDCKPIQSVRTLRQNDSLHLYFKLLAEELNNAGMDMRQLIRQEVEIQWTSYSVKEYLWRPLQKALLGKKSTTQLDKSQEINLIYDNLNRIIIDRTKGEVSIPFPSIENYD